MPHNNDIIFKKGDKVCCISGGFHIECIVVEDSDNHSLMIKVLDLLTGREIWAPRNQIDYDKQYYRNKALISLGI